MYYRDIEIYLFFMIKHPFEPIYDRNSEILILGSFPSVVSRKQSFYYANRNNRFWKIMPILFDETIGDSNSERTDFLLRHHIALWDVIKSCDIKGSSDNSISNVRTNDIKGLIDKTDIKRIYTTGKKAHELYLEYVYPKLGIEDINLPSTSSANARMNIDELVSTYRVIMNTIDSHMN